MVPQARPVPNFNNPFFTSEVSCNPNQELVSFFSFLLFSCLFSPNQLKHRSNKETTKPKSPKLKVTRRMERGTMMASSSTCMR